MPFLRLYGKVGKGVVEMAVSDEASWEDDLSPAERALLADAVREARCLYRRLQRHWPHVVAFVERAQREARGL